MLLPFFECYTFGATLTKTDTMTVVEVTIATEATTVIVAEIEGTSRAIDMIVMTEEVIATYSGGYSDRRRSRSPRRD
jgi:hypothetical protein